MENRPEEKKLRHVSFVAHVARGLVRNQVARRGTMLGVVIVALLMVVCGATFLRELLNPNLHLLRFILFWLACAWLTALSFLLALFDVLMLRAQNRAARNALRQPLP
ncbi:MAG: hypothetical protein M3R10_01470 [Verrucomicrobiota bacterium]|nr:hypothetical protein [Verrucomicrobiota bacterium]